MKILVINNVYPDNAFPTPFIFVHQQVKALQKYGHDVRVLDIDLRSLRWKRKHGCYKDNYDGVNVYRVSFPFVTTHLNAIGKKLNYLIGLVASKKIICDWGMPDIVHAHFGKGAGIAGMAIKRRYLIPLMITEHSSYVLNSKSKEQIKYWFDAYEEADAIACVGKKLEAKLLSYGIDEKKLVLLPNIINTDVFKPLENKHNSKFTLISVGHLIAGKNHQFTIRVFAELYKKNRNTKLVIIGRGKEKSSLEKLACELGCRNAIQFIDQVPNEALPLLYCKAHCFILPSLYETFGVVYAEAISCGIPALGYKNGGAEDIIDFKVGNVFDTLDVESWVTWLEEFNAQKYQPIELHQFINERFGTDIFLHNINKIYGEILNYGICTD